MVCPCPVCPQVVLSAVVTIADVGGTAVGFFSTAVQLVTDASGPSDALVSVGEPWIIAERRAGVSDPVELEGWALFEGLSYCLSCGQAAAIRVLCTAELLASWDGPPAVNMAWVCSHLVAAEAELALFGCMVRLSSLPPSSR